VALDFLGAEAIQLAEEEGVGEIPGEFTQASAEGIPELAGLDVARRVAGPGGRAGPPSAVAIEVRSDLGARGKAVDGLLAAARPPQVVDDLVFQDADEPGSLARPARERLEAA
jgi:hypothetical protein